MLRPTLFQPLLTVLSVGLLAAHSWGADHPDILMIFTDDQGVHDVGCYGSEIATPHIDSLAKDGMKFNQFYAASSICTPSRFGLLTGQYPHRSQDELLSALMFMEAADAQRGLRRTERTFVSHLQAVGYQTALVGKWHLGHGSDEFWPTNHGFDSFFGHTGGCVDFFTLHYGNRPDWYRGREIVSTNGYATDVITDEAIAVMRRHRSSDRPLYLQVSYNAPHFGKAWNQQQGKPENVMQPKPADLQKVSGIADPLRRSFAAKVVGMDESIGRLLKTIDDLSLRDNTLVIFMTDHGGDPRYGGSNQPLRGEKATLFEGGIRVPCLVRWPAVVAAGSESDAVTCAIDWYATFGEMTGYEVDRTDGQSLAGILRGDLLPNESTSKPRTLVWKTAAHQSLDRKSWLAVRQGDWKFVQPPEQEPMLFDLSNDPNETNNLASRHPDLVQQMSQQ
ncbi:MAG: sulfatase-like hydrolase/transferase [Pirellulaceae bacterium]|nr:sulfatase-like hydrolase/transferase [Pirellulaceae bacterium]